MFEIREFRRKFGKLSVSNLENSVNNVSPRNSVYGTFRRTIDLD